MSSLSETRSRYQAAPLKKFEGAQRARFVWVVLIALFVTAFLASVGIGAVAIAPEQVIAILAKQVGVELPIAFGRQQESVLIAIRLPRVLLGCLVGAVLAICGAALQGLFRNPLADHSLIGVSSGAAVAVVGTIVLGVTAFSGILIGLGLFLLPAAAFLGGLLTTLIIYRLAHRDGRTVVATMLLAGIAINALTGAITGLLTFVATDAQLRNITFWSLGSLGSATWNAVGVVAPFTLLTIVLLPRLARSLNAFLLGEAEARHLGVNVERVKQQVVILTALAVGASVAVTGVIGFVGLVVPHVLRLLIGPDHRRLLPYAALLGASLLLGADLFSRTVVAPAELPLGVVTALIGAPFFLWLLLGNRARSSL